MRRDLFLHILNAVQTVDPYFQQRVDATGKLGLSALQKVVAAMRILAYGVPAEPSTSTCESVSQQLVKLLTISVGLL